MTFRTVPGADENAGLVVGRQLGGHGRLRLARMARNSSGAVGVVLCVLASVDATTEVERQGATVVVSNHEQRNTSDHEDVVLGLGNYGASVALLGPVDCGA